jgi:DNA invertase Pin-like site-specific DNA recombinase
MKSYLNCAIYTRKSSEEGLEQEFNSLDAQREACEAYIASQKHEGWKALPDKYDDGGFSGGNMDRPGLKRLLADIDAGKVKIVVVYKVDRLTRALSDFAKIVEQFDKKGVSFVSVTQQFNTTSSMGRLTLNVLLSFAQFEREVTSERIRDKISASKKKGMWMGGVLPLGYDVIDKKLIVNKEEAKTAQFLFETYLRLGNVRLLKEELDHLNIRTKTRSNQKGKYAGGAQFSRGALYKILISPVYKGMVSHKGKIYPGEHEPVIAPELWQQVQDKLQANMNGHKSGHGTKTPCLLTGLIYDTTGNRFSPTRSKRNGKHYRYYISQALLQYRSDQKPQIGRIPAHEIEGLVQNEIIGLLTDNTRITKVLGIDPTDIRASENTSEKAKQLGSKLKKTTEQSHDLLRSLLVQVTVTADKITISLNRAILIAHVASDQELFGISMHDDTSLQNPITLTVNARLLRCGVEKRIIASDGQASTATIRDGESLKSAIAKGYLWREQFFNGTYLTLEAIAQKNNLNVSYVSKMVELSFLPPEKIAIIMASEQGGITLQRLGRTSVFWKV